MTRKNSRQEPVHLPSAEEIQSELAQVESIDDFFGKEGVFSRLFARTMEEMLEAELSAQLGYEKYEVRGRNSAGTGNERLDYRHRPATRRSRCLGTATAIFSRPCWTRSVATNWSARSRRSMQKGHRHAISKR